MVSGMELMLNNETLFSPHYLTDVECAPASDPDPEKPRASTTTSPSGTTDLDDASDEVFGTRSEATDCTGELALMRAVLHDAILCIGGHGRPMRDRDRLADDALRWVLSSDTTWIFSFESICDVLGIDSCRLRRRLVRHSQSRTSTVETADKPMSIRQIKSMRLRGNFHTTATPGTKSGAPRAAFARQSAASKRNAS